jgi:WD40 repeat protein
MVPVATKVAEFKEDDDVSGLEFSPDSKTLAVSTFITLHVHIWAWQGTSRIVRTLLKPRGTADYLSGDGLRYSPDGHLLAVVHGLANDADGSGVVRVFDPETGAIVHSIPEPLGGGDRTRIAFSPDGKFLFRTYSTATKNRDQFMVHRVGTWEAVWGLPTIPLDVMALAVSPVGDLAAVGGVTLGPGIPHVAQILIIDLKKRQIVRTINDVFPSENQVQQLAWNPDGVHLAASGIVGGSYSVPDAVRVFDVSTGLQVVGEPVNPAHVSGLRYAADGRYLVEAGVDRDVRIWDGQHRVLLQSIPARNANAIAISRDSAYLTFADAARVTIWKLN